MTESTTTATGTAPELHVGWLMPEFFQPLPVDAVDEDELVERIVGLARTVLAGHSTDDQHFFAQLMLQQTARLIDAEAEYAGLCFVEHEGEPTMATLLVNRVPSLAEDVEDAAAETEALLRRRFRDDEIRTHVLPAQRTPAVTRTGGIEVSVPGELSPDGQPQVLPQGVVQTYVPLPGQGETMVFELSTPSESAWGLYQEMFGAIVETLDWATDAELAEQRELQRLAEPAAVADPYPAAPVRPEVAAALRHWSSRVLDVVGMQGPLREEADELVAVACAPCRAKGLTSGCTSRHHWEMVQLPAPALRAMLAAARTRLPVHGLTPRTSDNDQRLTLTAPGDALSAQGYTVTLTAGDGTLAVDTATACTRATTTTVASDFG